MFHKHTLLVVVLNKMCGNVISNNTKNRRDLTHLVIFLLHLLCKIAGSIYKMQINIVWYVVYVC